MYYYMCIYIYTVYLHSYILDIDCKPPKNIMKIPNKNGCQLQAAGVVAAGRQLLQAPATQRIGARPLAVPGQAQATESRLDLGKHHGDIW